MRLLALVLLLTAGAFGQTIEEVVREAMAAHRCPGAVVLVGHRGKVIYRQAIGQRAVAPAPEPMTVDTVFDLASLTKVVCTAPCIMQLVEQGRVRLNDPLSKYLELEDPQARQVTLQDLLVHLSGFRGGLDRTRPWQGLSGAEAEVRRERLQHPPGTHFEYSDINYIALGLVVQKVTGQRLDEYARDHLWGPLGMKQTSFGPREGPVAPTQERGGVILRGTVHDHVSSRMGGIAGHAGVFSTADDLAIFCQSILDGGAGVARMARPVVVSEAGWTRGLGWDIDTSYSSNRGELFPKGSFGHTGWTGTSLWIDPSSQSYVVFLSNRVHPDGTGDVTPLRARVATLAAASLKDVDPLVWRTAEQGYAAQVTAALPEFLARVRSVASQPGTPAPSFRVLNGVDILQEDDYRQLQGLRLGLVTNQTGRSRQGELTADLLRKNAQLVRLYSPEHGFLGVKDEAVADSVYEGIPVVSLYGEKKRPTDLNGLDALVFDVQDAGARFYTYSATLRYVMEEAAKAHLPVFVLDRPNPLNGVDVEGPVATSGDSFTCPHTLPVRHGMTIGELARMFNEERALGCDLRVIPMDPWSRPLWFDQTQQTWVNPSPNLRSLTAAALYPGVGLLEFTNLSVGRGTDRPFEQLGAPWLDGPRLAALVNAAAVPGVRLMPVRFTPSSSRYAGISCGGVAFVLTDRSRLRPVRLGLELCCALLRLHPGEWETAHLGKLWASEDTVRRILGGETPAQIEDSWQAGLAEFKARRGKWLIYK